MIWEDCAQYPIVPHSPAHSSTDATLPSPQKVARPDYPPGGGISKARVVGDSESSDALPLELSAVTQSGSFSVSSAL